ncbi:unnamed protein product [Schistosoma margrebowiei]|nr:unnamed protein product [Schistosoma margrebowiei]
MLIASFALRFAFPSQLYTDGVETGPANSGYDSLRGVGGEVSLESKKRGFLPSSDSLRSLRDTFNPKDMFNDAIHNFHPNYQKYTQQRNLNDFDDETIDSYQGNTFNGNTDLTNIQSTVPAPPIPPPPRP